MSDAIAFLLILPALLLGVAVLDAAGTLGTASYRSSTLAEAAAVYAAEALAHSSAPGVDPSDRARWDEVTATVGQAGLAATAGVCDQTDAAFEVGLISQPGSAPSVGAVVSCPVELSRLLTVGRVVAASVETVG